METTAIQLSSTDSIKEFDALKLSVKVKTDILKAILVTDETSLSVATKQLSAAKSLLDDIEAKRVALKAPSLDFGRQIDAAAKDIISPLNPEYEALKKRVLEYDQAEEKKKAEATAALQAQQDQLSREAEANALAMKPRMDKFKEEAGMAINKAATVAELSSAYKIFVLSYPEEYGLPLQDTIRSLGRAKQKALNNPSDENTSSFEKMYIDYFGIKLPSPEPTFIAPMFDKLEEQKAVIQSQSTGSKIKKTWNFEVIDVNLVPREMMMEDEKKIKAYIKENSNTIKNGDRFYGIHFFEESNVVVK